MKQALLGVHALSVKLVESLMSFSAHLVSKLLDLAVIQGW